MDWLAEGRGPNAAGIRHRAFSVWVFRKIGCSLSLGQRSACSCLYNPQKSKQPNSFVDSLKHVQTLATWGQGESTYISPAPKEMGWMEGDIQILETLGLGQPSLVCSCYSQEWWKRSEIWQQCALSTWTHNWEMRKVIQIYFSLGFLTPNSQVNFSRPVISPTNLNSKKEGLTWVWFVSGRRSMSLMTVWAPQ